MDEPYSSYYIRAIVTREISGGTLEREYFIGFRLDFRF